MVDVGLEMFYTYSAMRKIYHGIEHVRNRLLKFNL